MAIAAAMAVRRRGRPRTPSQATAATSEAIEKKIAVWIALIAVKASGRRAAGIRAARPCVSGPLQAGWRDPRRSSAGSGS